VGKIGILPTLRVRVHRALMKRVLQEVIRERCKEFMRKRLEKESVKGGKSGNV